MGALGNYTRVPLWVPLMGALGSAVRVPPAAPTIAQELFKVQLYLKPIFANSGHCRGQEV